MSDYTLIQALAEHNELFCVHSVNIEETYNELRVDMNIVLYNTNYIVKYTHPRRFYAANRMFERLLWHEDFPIHNAFIGERQHINKETGEVTQHACLDSLVDAPFSCPCGQDVLAA